MLFYLTYIRMPITKPTKQITDNQIVNRGGQFALSGYDPSIDYIKGFAILCVVINHCISAEVQNDVLFTFWGAQAVPLFLIIQVFHSYKRGFDAVSLSFAKLWKRIIKPFLFVSFVLYCIYIALGIKNNIGVGEQTVHFLKSGGVGPGSYYFWIYLQFAFILPLLTIVLKKFTIWGNLLFFIVLSILLELVCSFSHLPEWLYRLLFFRYVFLIFIGYYLVQRELRINICLIIIAIVSACFLFVFQYLNFDFEPFFFKSDWKTQHWITYGYDLLLVYVLCQLYLKRPNTWLTRFFLLLGKQSYDVFLWQMFYFFLPIKSIFDRYLTASLSEFSYVLFSLIVCIIPVLYVKSKKDFLLVWNLRK